LRYFAASLSPAEPLMPEKKSARKSEQAPAARLSPAEMQLLEKLIAKNLLIAVPPKRMGKPRPVFSASLTPGGKSILLYLSQEPAAIA
jgi:hypothetical protein